MTRTRALSGNLGIDTATETGTETETVVSNAEVTRADLVAAVESGEAGEGAEGGINMSASASHQVDDIHTVLIETIAGCITSKQRLCPPDPSDQINRRADKIRRSVVDKCKSQEVLRVWSAAIRTSRK